MKYKALIGALALTFGLATVSHAQATAKDSTKKATVSATAKKKHHRSHKKASSAIAATAPFSDDPCQLLSWANTAVIGEAGITSDFVTAAGCM